MHSLRFLSVFLLFVTSLLLGLSGLGSNPEFSKENTSPFQIASSKCKLIIKESATSQSLDRALYWGNAALIIAKKLNEDSLQAFSHLNLGYLYLDSHKNIDSAIFHLKESLVHFNASISPDYISSIITGYNKLGTAYLYSSNYSLALENFLMALTLNKKYPEQGNIAHQFGNISIVYLYMKEYDDALKYNHKALAKYKIDNDSTGIFKSELNIGNIYVHIKNYERSLVHYRKALQFISNQTPITSKAGLYNNFSSAYIQLKKPIQALEFAQLSNSLLPFISDEYYKSEIYLTCANAFYSNNEFNTSIYYSDKCINVSSGYFNDILKDALLVKSRTLEKLKDYKNALNYYFKYDSINELVFDENTSQQMIEMQYKYYAKENELLIQCQKEELSKINTVQYRLISALIINFVFLLILFIVVTFRYYQINKIINARYDSTNSKTKLQKNNMIWILVRYILWLVLSLVSTYFIVTMGFEEAQNIIYICATVFVFVELSVHLWYKIKYGKNISESE